MQRSCRRWRFLCRVPLRPLSGAVGQLESEGRESTFWSLTEWGVVTSSWWLSLRTLKFSSHVSSAYGETQGEANLCSLDQYPITFTYLVVLRVREAHRTGPSRECECSIAALPATRRNVCWFYSTNQSNLPPHLTCQWFCLEKWGWFFFFAPAECHWCGSGCTLAARLQHVWQTRNIMLQFTGRKKGGGLTRWIDFSSLHNQYLFAVVVLHCRGASWHTALVFFHSTVS